jgi:hypothetical protein
VASQDLGALRVVRRQPARMGLLAPSVAQHGIHARNVTIGV